MIDKITPRQFSPAAALQSSQQDLFFPYIDVVRAVAIIFVVIYHLIEAFGGTANLSNGWFRILQCGWIGVYLFFVISGFVIALSLVKLIEKFGTNNYIAPYFRKRLVRIVPLYFLTCWCYLMLVKPSLFNSSPDYFWTMILSHVFFIHNLWYEHATNVNSPTWSIAVEMQFYVFMALSFKWLPLKRPILIALTFILVALAWRTWIWVNLEPGASESSVYLSIQQLPGTLDAFGAGCAVALIVLNRQHIAHKYLKASWKNSMLWLAVALCFSVGIFFFFTRYLTQAWDTNPISMVVFFRLIITFTFTAWLCFSITLYKTATLKIIFFPLLYIGKISYGIYLWHMLILYSLIQAGIKNQFQITIVAIIMVLVISSFTWHLFEKPLIQKFSVKKAPSSSPVSVRQADFGSESRLNLN
jgi:peptidoglycan/LPS O-acetylase OafA/YrhL